MFISVVLAVYNAERYIKFAVESILRQSYPHFEFIIVDDRSTDQTPAILDTFTDKRLVRIRNDQNLGQTRSLNKGIGHAKGELIARQDADDISHPERFHHQVSFFQNHQAVGLLGSAYELIDDNGHVWEIVYPPTGNLELQKHLERGNIFCHGSVMIKRSVLDQVGGYRDKFPVTQDYELWLRIAEHSELANLPESLYQFRFHSESISHNRRKLQLSYSRLAWELAVQRRTQGIEGLIPEDVIHTYPPEPGREIGESRWAGYLFYVAEQPDRGAREISQAYQIEKGRGQYTISWEEWAWKKARHLAIVRKSLCEGTKFIRWVFDILPIEDKKNTIKETLGKFYSDQAFLAHQRQSRKQVLLCSLRAIYYDRRLLKNRGLWSISRSALLRL